MNEPAKDQASASTPEATTATPPAQPTPGGFPLFLTGQKVLPRKYIIHIHSQHCKNCGSVHEWSAAYAFNNMMSRTGSGKLVTNLVPISEFNYNLPIEVLRAARTMVPACHECAPKGVGLSHLPDPTNTNEWRRVYAVAAAPQAPDRGRPPAKTPREKRQPKPLPTIDDLL